MDKLRCNADNVSKISQHFCTAISCKLWADIHTDIYCISTKYQPITVQFITLRLIKTSVFSFSKSQTLTTTLTLPPKMSLNLMRTSKSILSRWSSTHQHTPSVNLRSHLSSLDSHFPRCTSKRAQNRLKVRCGLVIMASRRSQPV